MIRNKYCFKLLIAMKLSSFLKHMQVKHEILVRDGGSTKMLLIKLKTCKGLKCFLENEVCIAKLLDLFLKQL